MNNRQALEGGRATFAFEKVKFYMDKYEESDRKELRSNIKRLPSMIKVNGLGQSLAFYFANMAKRQMGPVYTIMDEWAKQRFADLQPERKNNQEFVEWVISLNSIEYKIVTMEMMALLNWMRRFADGLVKSND